MEIFLKISLKPHFSPDLFAILKKSDVVVEMANASEKLLITLQRDVCFTYTAVNVCSALI